MIVISLHSSLIVPLPGFSSLDQNDTLLEFMRDTNSLYPYVLVNVSESLLWGE